MKYFTLIIFTTLIIGCSQINLAPSDFAWPIESVLAINEDGFISENRFSFSTNVKQLFFEEFNDSTSYKNESVRIIRDADGFYYMIANGFKNVYLFTAENGKFNLANKFLVSEFGLDLPAFNQRKPYVELLEGEKHLVFINVDGIKEINSEN
jgi:hypothetical protein